jgi:hypothetical protein
LSKVDNLAARDVRAADGPEALVSLAEETDAHMIVGTRRASTRG